MKPKIAYVGAVVAAFTLVACSPETSAPKQQDTPENWAKLGQELIALRDMDNPYSKCATDECREHRYIAAGRMITRIEDFPTTGNWKPVEKAATEYAKSYDEYLDYDCTPYIKYESFECDTTQAILDARGVLLPKIASLLASETPVPH